MPHHPASTRRGPPPSRLKCPGKVMTDQAPPSSCRRLVDTHAEHRPAGGFSIKLVLDRWAGTVGGGVSAYHHSSMLELVQELADLAIGTSASAAGLRHEGEGQPPPTAATFALNAAWFAGTMHFAGRKRIRAAPGQYRGPDRLTGCSSKRRSADRPGGSPAASSGLQPGAGGWRGSRQPGGPACDPQNLNAAGPASALNEPPGGGARYRTPQPKERFAFFRSEVVRRSAEPEKPASFGRSPLAGGRNLCPQDNTRHRTSCRFGSAYASVGRDLRRQRAHERTQQCPPSIYPTVIHNICCTWDPVERWKPMVSPVAVVAGRARPPWATGRRAG